MLTRRQLINGAFSVATAGLSGCASLVRPITVFCPDDPRISDPNTPLTIDVHAHVFNGTDIQVERYITLVQGLPAFGQILQQANWSRAPSGAQETSVLREINQQLSAGCRPGTFERIHVTHRNEQHRLGARELKRALRKAERRRPGLRSTPEGEAVAKAIQSLPESYADYQKQQKFIGGGSIDAVVAFVVRQFQYRYVNVFDFLTEYSSGPSRKIDLIVCHFLDFDWPLALGRQTRTPIADQIDVMEQISILTGGRVHFYVPFDPMKQVAHDDLNCATESPMELVRKAIAQGCIGVKLYPPIGFAPSGNVSLPANFWQRTWLPNEIKRAKHFGRLLDKALLQLYSWCLMNDVPIMAHTSPSQGPCDEFKKKLTAARYWKNVPSGLRVNFGHFGNTEIPQDKPDTTSKYVELMGDPGSHGANFYADAAYLSHTMSQPSDLTQALRTLFNSTSGPLLTKRLMYGSDWEMLIIEGSASERYLSNFEKIFSVLDRDFSSHADGKLSDRFFGVNATNYLSLRPGSGTRNRLNMFYAMRGIRTPQWAQKVDALPPLVA
jgi:hypothetical protein